MYVHREKLLKFFNLSTFISFEVALVEYITPKGVFMFKFIPFQNSVMIVCVFNVLCQVKTTACFQMSTKAEV